MIGGGTPLREQFPNAGLFAVERRQRMDSLHEMSAADRGTAFVVAADADAVVADPARA